MALIAAYREARLQRETLCAHQGPAAAGRQGWDARAPGRAETPNTQPAAAPEPNAAFVARAETQARSVSASGAVSPPSVLAGEREARRDPPLSEMGFGPGMLIRLGQLGLYSVGDLARSDASELRAALGDISRLINVEAWINQAREIV
ncbi:MAG: hypothetical protein WDN49_07685 [Acetobacteraceae bacterium]